MPGQVGLPPWDSGLRPPADHYIPYLADRSAARRRALGAKQLLPAQPPVALPCHMPGCTSWPAALTLTATLWGLLAGKAARLAARERLGEVLKVARFMVARLRTVSRFLMSWGAVANGEAGAGVQPSHAQGSRRSA